MEELDYLVAGYQRRNWAIFEGLYAAYLRSVGKDELITIQTTGTSDRPLAPSYEILTREPMLPELSDDANVMRCKKLRCEVRYQWKS